MADKPLQIGDRVKLDPDHAEGWLQPLRKFAQEGRMGTVTATTGLRWAGEEYMPRIEFDVKRKGAKPHRERFSDDARIILVERPVDSKGDA